MKRLKPGQQFSTVATPQGKQMRLDIRLGGATFQIATEVEELCKLVTYLSDCIDSHPGAAR